MFKHSSLFFRRISDEEKSFFNGDDRETLSITKECEVFNALQRWSTRECKRQVPHSQHLIFTGTHE
jgi:hypothetical protein